jgi:TRAP-type uncharacterized transport system substrate-binding protein
LWGAVDGGWVFGIGLRVLAAILCLVAAVWLALWYFIPAPPTALTIAIGFKGGAFDNIAGRYREELASHKVALNVRYTEGAFDSLKLLNDAKSGVDAAFLFAGITNGAKSPDLVSLGRINYAPYWIFYRGAEPIDRLTQLRGKRVIVNGAVRGVIMPLLGLHGVNADNTTLRVLPGVIASKALVNGEADVAFLPPQEMDGPEVQPLLRNPDIRLLNLAQADALVRLFPALSRLVLPQGVIDLEKNIPASDVNLVASTNVVVVRKELHPELIYLLAQTLQEVHGGAGVFQKAGEFPTQTDPEFPVAEEARDFYRNGPSFLHRYLPFWMINITKRIIAVLVTALAIVIPLLTYAPRLYAWFLRVYLAKLYRRLRLVETELETELTAPQVETLQTDLESINRAARILPLRHLDLFFDLIMHIDLTRTRLAARLGGSRS